MKVRIGFFLLVIFVVLLSSCKAELPNQVSVFELLNGMKDKTDVEDYGILEKGDYDQVIADYEVALRIDPNDTDIRQALEDARQKLQLQKG